MKIRLIGDGNTAICSKCNEIKDIAEFGQRKQRNGTAYWLSYCNACLYKQMRVQMAYPRNYLNRRYCQIRRKCADGNIPFTIARQEFYSIYEEQHGQCFYTDAPLPLQIVDKHLLRKTFSIDRIIPELGYASGNVVFCTYRANTIKSDCTLAEMKLWLPLWYARIMVKLRREGHADWESLSR